MKTVALILYCLACGYLIKRADLDKRAMYVLEDFWDELNARAAKAHLREIDIHDAMKRVESKASGS